MQTIIRYFLLVTILAQVSMILGFDSKVFAVEEAAKTALPATLITDSIYRIKSGEWEFCVDIDPSTLCPKETEAVKDCKSNEVVPGIPKDEYIKSITGHKIINIQGTSCQSFVIEVEGNTISYCTPWACYPR